MAALDSYSMFICFKNWNMRFDAQILYIVLYQGVFMATAWDSAAANIQERSFVCNPKKSSKRWNRGNYGENIIYNILEIT